MEQLKINFHLSKESSLKRVSKGFRILYLPSLIDIEWAYDPRSLFSNRSIGNHDFGSYTYSISNKKMVLSLIRNPNIYHCSRTLIYNHEPNIFRDPYNSLIMNHICPYIILIYGPAELIIIHPYICTLYICYTPMIYHYMPIIYALSIYHIFIIHPWYIIIRPSYIHYTPIIYSLYAPHIFAICPSYIVIILVR